jgi:heat shock protein HslJ
MTSVRLGAVPWAVILLTFICGVYAQTSPQNSSGDLGGTSWQLVKFEGSDGKTLTPDAKTRYTIEFRSDGSVGVGIDCNRGHGTWKSPGNNQLEFGPLALTRAMCPSAPISDRLTKDWTYVRSYILKDGHLFLSLMADGGIYEFEPALPKLPATLENTYWKLTQLGEAPVTMADQQKEPYFILNPETHRVSGAGGCNTLVGSYELSGARLKLNQLAGTAMACLQGMDTEKAFLQALGRADSWKITGERLELFDAYRNMVARFESRYMKH